MFWVKVTVTRPLPTGRQAFGLGLEGYGKLLSPIPRRAG
jgi:hypothetical protein